MLPLDLHVLSLPLAFILSQDQTLRCTYFFNVLTIASLACVCLYLLPLSFLSQIFQWTFFCPLLSFHSIPTFFGLAKLITFSFFTNLSIRFFLPHFLHSKSGCKSNHYFIYYKMFFELFYSFFTSLFFSVKKVCKSKTLFVFSKTFLELFSLFLFELFLSLKAAAKVNCFLFLAKKTCTFFNKKRKFFSSICNLNNYILKNIKCLI